MIAPRTNVEIHSGWKTQSCQDPVSAGRGAVTEESVVHIVTGRFENNTRKLRAGAGTRPGNGILRHGKVLQRGSIVIETSERVVVSQSERAPCQDLAISRCYQRNNTKAQIRVERVCHTGNTIEPGDVIPHLAADGGELAAGNDLAVRLHQYRIDRTI